ncbi:hypothetical protein [Cyanobium sp. N5-Cardenillas]|uniref:hypothetical protein n=1 Tax=Cyanobium sp. N5-Cardenillas TaxID=2823720 RepID=UPI0020CCA233|nr:hypothetical protein [Cyanobium sp. N5-Cardenillas]MCP9787229.1 hypothetical protein [Cyanobium sp. N5-Cardenillas]
MITAPLLVRWYATLATVSALLATQAIVFPRWQEAPGPLPTQQLEAGLREANLLSPTKRPSSTTPWPAMRRYELATSAPVVFPLRGGFELTLMHATVRQRFNFQTGTMGRAQPSLKLSKRRLIDTPVPTATGLAQDRPVFQTCLVSGPGLVRAFGVTRDQLAANADQLSSGIDSAVARVIGLEPNRTYACTLISLRGPKGDPPSDRLWRQVLDLVEPVLRSQG